MRKLPKKIQSIIKKKTFSLDTLQDQCNWRGGVLIDYRITMVKANEEEVYGYLNPMNNQWGYNYVNIKVKGVAQMRGRGEELKTLVEIGKATKTKKSYWGGYESKHDYVWGCQVNKKIRNEIRKKAQKDVRDFLKLLGCITESWDGGIKIGTISWEK